jgi:hypothetical protein
VRRLVIVAVVLGAALAMPSAASALSCAAGPLDMLQGKPVAFIGQVTEAREAIAVLRVQEGVKGAQRVLVRWGHLFGIPGVPTTERAVPSGRILRLTHRYPRRGRVLVQVTAFSATDGLCGSGGGSAHRELLVRVR